MLKSDSLCWSCARTGCNAHLNPSNSSRIPKEIMPCKWISNGVMPKDCEYETRDVSLRGGEKYKSHKITACPKYVAMDSPCTSERKDSSEAEAKDAAVRKRTVFVCVETGEEFDSLKAAALFAESDNVRTGISAISAAIKRRGIAYGYHWKKGTKGDKNSYDEHEHKDKTDNGKERDIAI